MDTKQLAAILGTATIVGAVVAYKKPPTVIYVVNYDTPYRRSDVGKVDVTSKAPFPLTQQFDPNLKSSTQIRQTTVSEHINITLNVFVAGYRDTLWFGQNNNCYGRVSNFVPDTAYSTTTIKGGWSGLTPFGMAGDVNTLLANTSLSSTTGSGSWSSPEVIEPYIPYTLADNNKAASVVKPEDIPEPSSIFGLIVVFVLGLLWLRR